ncbi:MAG: hypothetical protein A2W98_05800 [Bacteroidetes bacterium GWF2_33_38]|nr:MAG: hypothetical protein A2W98_05800 [Bacteroidetes bacterium GWF2_33_38]OFY69988.1 MAG: hypothetical protein A2265_00470 [Bacteroidetes bacterium RIFOXYA12_FULL_33_9]HBX51675.1 coenzyme A pyrophosphatase [Bacteroidales bacterium]
MYSDFYLALEQRLNAMLPGADAQKLLSPSLRNSHFELDKENECTKASAVLLYIYPFNKNLHIAFIKRQTYNGVHSGQISFPGGKRETSDKSLEFTALRESNEEIGIDIKDVRIIGKLTPLFIPVSNIIVFPFVGVSTKKPHFRINENEVVEIIHVKLNDLNNQDNYKRKNIIENGFDIDVPYFDARGNHVWGATAMILSEFIEMLKEINTIR